MQVEPSRGKTPRNIALDPDGTHFLAANQDSGQIVIFKRDASSGRITPDGQVLDIPSPVCILFVPLNGR